MSEIIKDEFMNDVDRILNMTDKQAAEVLEKVQVWMNSGRRNGKTLLSLAYNKAIEKAIKALEAVRWIPITEKKPDELVAVNITYVNHNPETYYDDIKDKPFTATGVYFNGQWYWWSILCTDTLAEYSHNYDDIIDKDIEVTAWKPLPKPYESEDK